MSMEDWIGVNELYWLTVQFKSLEADYSSQVKTLKDLCLEKLVSDVCLFRNLSGMPQIIHSLLLSKALDLNRTLSISQLMKYSRYEEFKLPLPDVLEDWQCLMNSVLFYSYSENHLKNAVTLLSTFICLMEEDYNTSQLEILDLGIYPWGDAVLTPLFEFVLTKYEKMEKLSKTYTLKISLKLSTMKQADTLSRVLNACEAIGFKLVVTGLLCHNHGFHQDVMLNILEKLEPSEFVHFSLRYAQIHPPPIQFLTKLQSFKNLKYFGLSYNANDFSEEPLLSTLAATLHELPQISHLILQGNQLRGCLGTILQNYCKKNRDSRKRHRSEDNNCCIVHNGKLEFLNIAACKLLNEDVLFLRELSLTGNLKYLNVNYNSLNGLSGFESLLALKSSLIILEMEDAFSGLPLYKAELFPFSTFTQLKYLNMRGLSLKQSVNFPEFAAERNKALYLKVNREPLDQPPHQSLDFHNINLPRELFFLAPGD